MKRWLPRSLWLLAWSLWAWLGFGLHRELPRDAGAPVCKLTLRPAERLLGFIPKEAKVVTLEDERTRPIQVRVYDGRTGELRQTISWSAVILRDTDRAISLRHGVLLAEEGPRGDGQDGLPPPAMLNFRTGVWTSLPLSKIADVKFADHSPRALFTFVAESQPTNRPKPAFFDFFRPAERRGEVRQVSVIDLTNPRVLFQWAPKVDDGWHGELSGSPFFIGDDAVGIPTYGKLQVWSLATPSDPPRDFANLHTEFGGTTVSTSKRFAWRTLGVTPSTVDVFDLERCKLILSKPPNEERKLIPGGTTGGWPDPVLSDDDRTVMDVMGRKLYDIESGRELWSPQPSEELTRVWKEGMFQVFEKWPALSPLWNEEKETVAFRDLKTGRTLFRRWSWIPDRDWIDVENGLFVDHDGSVLRYPGQVRWPIIILVQSILALPLIILWAVLRWRRKRRVRLARVQP